MAEIFKARLPGVAGFEKIVVIKRMRPELSNKKDMVDMFIREAKLAAEIHHANIVQVFELEQSDKGELFMVLEYVEGTDLRRLLQASNRGRRRIPPWFSLKVTCDVLEGLAYAHELRDREGRPRSIVHRDVSPSNVFISHRGEVKLGDFGVAKDHSRTEQTVTGTIKGKLGYMAPEQLYHRPLDQRTDVFAAGVMLWEMLTQRRLFGGKRRPEIETMNLICSGPRIPPSTLRDDVPEALDAVVLTALQPSPSQRYLTARDFQNRLIDVLQTLKARIFPEDLMAVVARASSSKKVPAPRESQSDSGRGSFESSSARAAPRPSESGASRIFDVDVHQIEPRPARPARYDGPYPFWLEVSGAVSGPHSYFDTLAVARDRTAAGVRVRLSADGRTWVEAARFAELTGQQALFEEDVTRDLSAQPHGLLEEKSVVALLAELTEQRATAQAIIMTSQSDRALESAVHLDEGRATFVGSNLYRLQLPEVLTAAKLVTSGQLPELFHRVLVVGDPLEAFVSDLNPGWTQESIRRLLMEERLVTLLGWRSGTFTVQTGTGSGQEPFTESLLQALPALLTRAFDQASLTRILRDRIEQPFVIARGFSRRITRLGLDPIAFDAARALARGESLESLSSEHPEHAHAYLSTAYLLLEIGLLE